MSDALASLHVWEKIMLDNRPGNRVEHFLEDGHCFTTQQIQTPKLAFPRPALQFIFLMYTLVKYKKTRECYNCKGHFKVHLTTLDIYSKTLHHCHTSTMKEKSVIKVRLGDNLSKPAPLNLIQTMLKSLELNSQAELNVRPSAIMVIIH